MYEIYETVRIPVVGSNVSALICARDTLDKAVQEVNRLWADRDYSQCPKPLSYSIRASDNGKVLFTQPCGPR